MYDANPPMELPLFPSMKTLTLLLCLLVAGCCTHGATGGITAPLPTPHEAYVRERKRWESEFRSLTTGIGREQVHALVSRATNGKVQSPAWARVEDRQPPQRYWTMPGDIERFELDSFWSLEIWYTEEKLVYQQLSYAGPRSDYYLENADIFWTLPIIDAVCDPNDGYRFDPLPLIRAVNALQRLGKSDAVRALRAYMYWAMAGNSREGSLCCDWGERVFFICLLLFEHRDGDPQMPGLELGQPDVVPKEKSRNWPLFPLILIHDIPFCMVNGYMLAGFPEQPWWRVDWCDAFCNVRTRQLSPDVDPAEASELLLASRALEDLEPTWQSCDNTEGEERLGVNRSRVQAVRALSNLYDRKLEWELNYDDKLDWTPHREALKKLAPRWDERSQKFVAGQK